MKARLFETPTSELGIDPSSLLESLQRDCESVQSGLSMTANENAMSRVSLSFLNSALESRYYLGNDNRHGPLAAKEGLLYRRLCGVIALEAAAKTATQQMLGAAWVDFRPLSGVHAMMATILALTDPGDTVYSLSPDAGGHFATSSILSRIGRRSRFLPWNKARFDIDLGGLMGELQQCNRPKLVFLDPGMTLFPLDLCGLRACLGPKVLIAFDASHTLGLIFGGGVQNPLYEGCDILQGNTHKSFPGPQKALVAFRTEGIGQKFSKAMDDGLVSSQHTHHSAALALSILEMEQYGELYAKQMLRNAKTLASALQNHGFGLIHRDGVPTTSHVIALDRCGSIPINHACEKLMLAGISANARPFLGNDVLRLGVQELTRRGMKELEMRQIALLMRRLLLQGESPHEIKLEVFGLRKTFDVVHFSFDQTRACLTISTG